MNTSSYNHARTGALLNLAGHPGTPDNEALTAVRRAYQIYSQHHEDSTLGDAVRVDAGFVFTLRTTPKKEFLKQIADLEDERDEAISQRDDAISERDACVAEADGHVAALQEALQEARRRNERLIDERDHAIAERDSAIAARDGAAAGRDALVSGISAKDSQIASLQKALREARCRTDSQDRSAAVNENERSKSGVSVTSEEASTRASSIDDHYAPPSAPKWTLRARKQFNAYVELGMTKARIARLLTQQLLYKVTPSMVAEMMRQRWRPDASGFLWLS